MDFGARSNTHGATGVSILCGPPAVDHAPDRCWHTILAQASGCATKLLFYIDHLHRSCVSTAVRFCSHESHQHHHFALGLPFLASMSPSRRILLHNPRQRSIQRCFFRPFPRTSSHDLSAFLGGSLNDLYLYASTTFGFFASAIGVHTGGHGSAY